MFIHAGMADRTMWDGPWDALTAAFDVVRLDLRGYGESVTPPGGRWSHGGDVLGVLDHLGIGRCHLVGSSLGAGVATEVALSRPALARSLLLCPPGGSLLAELTDDLRGFIDDWPDVAHLPSMERPDDFSALVRDWVLSCRG